MCSPLSVRYPAIKMTVNIIIIALVVVVVVVMVVVVVVVLIVLYGVVLHVFDSFYAKTKKCRILYLFINVNIFSISQYY